MISRKKIVLVGPSGVGKTTLQKVYFEHVDPLLLLEENLQPSRGINSRIYTTTRTDLGIFDLAGQENKLWFSDKGKDVFNESNIIVCVFDITNSLESIIKFLINIYKLKKDLHLHSCSIVAFLHKIDLRSNSYVYNKLKTIQEFITIQHPRGENFKMYQTSITKDNFYNTFCIISEILNLILKKDTISFNHEEVQELKKQLYIIINSDFNVRYKTADLSLNLKFHSNETRKYLEKLEELGLVESFDEYNFFKLTNTAYYFKIGLEKDIVNREKSYLNKRVELFHFILYLREKLE